MTQKIVQKVFNTKWVKIKPKIFSYPLYIQREWNNTHIYTPDTFNFLVTKSTHTIQPISNKHVLKGTVLILNIWYLMWCYTAKHTFWLLPSMKIFSCS